jgi:hypothetical protein
MPVLNRIMQFITSKYLKFGEGEIWFGKEQVVVYSLPERVEELHNNLKLFGLDYGLSMFLSSKNEGSRIIRNNIVPLKKILSPVVSLSCETISSLGYGPIRTLKVDEKEGFMVLVGRSTIADEYKKTYGASESPIDFILGGVFTGSLEVFSNKMEYCVEIKCSAQKDVEECVWVVGSREKILNYTKQFAPESVEWANTVLNYMNKNGVQSG